MEQQCRMDYDAAAPEEQAVVLYSAASVAAPTFNNPIKCEGFAHVTPVAVPCLHVPIHTEIWPHCTS